MSRRAVTLSSFLWLFISPFISAQDEVPPPKTYADAVRALETLITHEVADKKLPALSIALVDNQQIVWAKGFGYADPSQKKPATARTIYRVGSVSKLFTDLAVMKLVEQGKLDIDAPVDRYLPDFKPENPFKKPITLRQLMTHRSGLVRESAVGSYFDPTTPTLEKTIASLNATKLVYEPETRIKYSNSGIAVVGRALEVTQKKPFVDYLTATILEPLAMKDSSFAPTAEQQKELAKAVMWTYHGREFPAPTWELGMPPAGSLYTNVIDISKFLSVLFKGGDGHKERLLKQETLEAMYKPQFAKKDDKSGFGLGFYVREWQGKRRIGHGGAVYGFATDLSALPDEKLGVIVVTSRDVANAVTARIADVALESMLAVKDKKPLPKIEIPKPCSVDDARKHEGRYVNGKRMIELAERGGKLWATLTPPGLRVQVRQLGEAIVTDDPQHQGLRLLPEKDGLRVDKDIFRRTHAVPPKPLPKKWEGLIGEYGWDHNTLYILEKDGALHCLIEWVFLYPLEEESENVYRFPAEYGLYHGEKLIFSRDKSGRATKVVAAEVAFERCKLDGEGGKTFRIEPRRPVAELRKEALAAKPPPFKGEFNEPDLVELISLDPTIKLDVRYATANNFLGTPLYESAKAFLQRPAAQALVRVHRKLKDQGYGLLIHDGYRPWFVTRIFWDATPEQFHHFVADPEQGSRHNRGCAVDLTLFELKTGKAVEMPGGYDEFSDRSYAEYPGGTSLQRARRDILRRAMEDEGFQVIEQEWWHFDYKDWRKYPILNKRFEDLTPKR